MRANYQKRHYEQIAALLRDMVSRADLFSAVEISGLTERLIVLFESDNPRFDEGRFRDAVWQHPTVTHQPDKEKTAHVSNQSRQSVSRPGRQSHA
jgi:hypothetical protein